MNLNTVVLIIRRRQQMVIIAQSAYALEQEVLRYDDVFLDKPPKTEQLLATVMGLSAK